MVRRRAAACWGAGCQRPSICATATSSRWPPPPVSVYRPLASAILSRKLRLVSALRLIPLIVASAVAVMTMWSLGFRSALYPLSDTLFQMDLTSLLMTVIIGFAAGVAGWLLIKLIARSKALFSRVHSLPFRLGAGGFAVGLLALISTDILGNGYEVIVKIIEGNYLLAGLLGLLVLKMRVDRLIIPARARRNRRGAAGGWRCTQRERVYVINQAGQFLGVVSIHDISRKVLAQEITLDSPVSSVMDDNFCIYQHQSMREGWEAFARVTLERLPVLNNAQERRFLGALTKTSLIQKAQEFL